MTIVDISAAVVIMAVLWLILPQYDKASGPQLSPSKDARDRRSLRTRSAVSRPLDVRAHAAATAGGPAGVGAGGARASGALSGGYSGGRSGSSSGIIVELPRSHSPTHR